LRNDRALGNQKSDIKYPNNNNNVCSHWGLVSGSSYDFSGKKHSYLETVIKADVGMMEKCTVA